MKHLQLLFAVLFCTASSVAYSANETPGSHTWIERQWEFRYVIKIESPYDYKRWRKFGQNEFDKGDVNVTQDQEPIFPLTTSILTDAEEGALQDNHAIGTVLVTFNQKRKLPRIIPGLTN
ncbi:hypothetical protein [Quatrionicoccus australiensis]|uniref:hypothetical protein n=1 Tax=Quatrionicoccus australiensis TaxID=138118 RepID=UPI001CFBFA4F|nr:hypothetical protein [Quatrionicoccus australiensis]MCB4359511.1 hypothetical protein [Quatrionicoccus australiensis]